MKQNWEAPRILDADSLVTGVGDCYGGGIATQFACINGDSTMSPTDQGGPHRCANGGYAGGDYGGCMEGGRPVGHED
ncbi:MAG: hypothetical protein FJ026_04500 [Chloroflexi bacterium]|nr:hypothetical protein [Chloroflexota bacterium]